MTQIKIKINDIHENNELLTNLKNMLAIETKTQEMIFAKYIINIFFIKNIRKLTFFQKKYNISMNETEAKAFFYIGQITIQENNAIIDQIHQKIIA